MSFLRLRNSEFEDVLYEVCSVNDEIDSLAFFWTTRMKSYVPYNHKRSYFGESIDIADEFNFLCLFIYFWPFLPKGGCQYNKCCLFDGSCCD